MKHLQRKQIFAARKQKMFLLQAKNIFASRTQILGPKNMFSTLATMKTVLTRFQCCLLKMFPSNGETTTMADHEVEEEEPQAGHRKGKGQMERNWRDKERERVTHCFV